MKKRLIFIFMVFASINAFPAEQPSQVRSGFIDVDGGSLFYEVAGTGDTLILIHDGLLHRVIWDEQFSVFSKRYRVIRYDRRGYGNSPKPDKPYSNVDDLLKLFDSLKIKHAGLIGMSSGGGLAVDFTLAHPTKVSSLVLVGAVVSGFSYTIHFLSRGGRADRAVYSSGESLRKYFSNKDPYILAPQDTTARLKLLQLLEKYPQDTDPEKFSLIQEPERPAIKFLSKITVPTLILAGEFDIPDVHAHAGALNAGIPNSRRIIIPGSGHLIPIEQPDLFNKTVLDFLKGNK